MPRKRASNAEESTVERRHSSRLAALPKQEPVIDDDASPRSDKPVSKKRKSEGERSDEGNVTSPRKRGRPAKNKTEENVDEKAEKAPKNDKSNENNEKSPGKHDFEVVNKDSVPAADSKEVASAIEAQGPDRDLLVDFVQVSKEGLPSPNSQEVKHITNQIENSTKKTVVEEVIKETKVSPGCNGNCGVESSDHSHNETATNGVKNANEQAKNGNHDSKEAKNETSTAAAPIA